MQVGHAAATSHAAPCLCLRFCLLPRRSVTQVRSCPALRPRLRSPRLMEAQPPLRAALEHLRRRAPMSQRGLQRCRLLRGRRGACRQYLRQLRLHRMYLPPHAPCRRPQRQELRQRRHRRSAALPSSPPGRCLRTCSLGRLSRRIMQQLWKLLPLHLRRTCRRRRRQRRVRRHLQRPQGPQLHVRQAGERTSRGPPAVARRQGGRRWCSPPARRPSCWRRRLRRLTSARR